MNLLKILESDFSVSRQFIQEYQTVEAMREKSRAEAEKTIFPSGFEKQTIEYQSTVLCSVHFRDAAWVLKERISETIDDEVIHSSHEDKNFSHFRNGEIGTKPCPAAERSTKCTKDSLVSWKGAGSDAIEPPAGCLQILTDK